MSIVFKESGETVENQFYRGVQFIFLEFEESVLSKKLQSYSETNALRSQVDEIKSQLLNKEEECQQLKERVDTLTKQKLHRDNVIEEHKKIQADLRQKIKEMKDS